MVPETLQSYPTCRKISLFNLCLLVILLAPDIYAQQKAQEPPTPPCLKINGVEGKLTRQDWGILQCDKTVIGLPLVVDGKTYTKGIGTHAISSIVFNLPKKKFKTFQAVAGLPDYAKNSPASVEFEVIGDGKSLWKSGIMKGGQSQPVSVRISGISKLELRVNNGENGIHTDHCLWLVPEFK